MRAASPNAPIKQTGSESKPLTNVTEKQVALDFTLPRYSEHGRRDVKAHPSVPSFAEYI